MADSPTSQTAPSTAEAERYRLRQARERTGHWRRWGPYLAERQWGTVREDYSADGNAWEYFTHDQARSRAYRWGEDGLLGICDNHQRLCLSLAMWNGNDDILKERAYGVTGKEGNHGEDVKEYYYFLDNLPSHAFMRALYKYPHAAFPYKRLHDESLRRTRNDPEFELVDTGIFNENRYFDVVVTYAKRTPNDLLAEIEVINRGPETASLHLLPTLVFRNTWSWTLDAPKPELRDVPHAELSIIDVAHETLGPHRLYAQSAYDRLFTGNETNTERIFKTPNTVRYVKDAFHACVVDGDATAVDPSRTGTKAALWYKLDLAPGERKTIRLRMAEDFALVDPLGPVFDETLALRRAEADAFYADLNPFPVSDDARMIQRQALAGMLWSKQYYHFVVRDWLKGDPTEPVPPPQRRSGRNSDWMHLYNDDVLSMPDTWEYPWFAAWDHAFHMIPLSMIDSDFAKHQLMRLLREWYMHPNGQIPAYEWEFGDVNPPVHAWASLRVFRIDRKMNGTADYAFLERTFQKLLLNFTWWVNRKDANGNNVFQGGFLGLDNIGVFNRSATLPSGGRLNQSDGTSWMAFYCLNMLAIALELAQENRAYEDIASKFFEHFLYIANAMNTSGSDGSGLWDEEEGFYLDVLALPDGMQIPLRVHSMVGLIPLLAVETLDPEVTAQLPAFTRRMEWFMKNRPDLAGNVASMSSDGMAERRLLAVVDERRLLRLLETVFDESAFLSPHGVRSLSKRHREHPYVLNLAGASYRIDYEPAESSSGLFGGNSNWRGPVWFPLNYLLIEALQKFHRYYGDERTVEFPTGSGKQVTLWEAASRLSGRLISLFTRDADGRRPMFGGVAAFDDDPLWRNLLPFHEYFNGDDGAGLGASHQTGWTALVAKLIQQYAEYEGQDKTPDVARKRDGSRTSRPPSSGE